MSILPSNGEVAVKLLEYALLVEGEEYWRRLERLRREALSIMRILEEFEPRLVGSVWRGIIKPGSDIDIEVDYEDPDPVKEKLEKSGYPVLEEGAVEVPEPLRFGSLWRLKFQTPGGTMAEVILKEHKWYINPPRCDIFGDVKRGLKPAELAEVLAESPRKLFIPENLRELLRESLN